jgi:ribonuclease HI
LKTWTLHTDGGCEPNPGNGGIGFVLTAPDGTVVYEGSMGIGRATNNIAEYQALIEGLKVALICEVPTLMVCSDSMLVMEQMKGRWRVKHAGLKPLHVEAKRIAASFRAIVFQWIPREQNERADALAGMGIASPPADVQAMDDHLLAIGREVS